MIKSLQRATLILALAGGTLTALTGCFPLVAGGMVTGALVASDRRTTGTVAEDQGIEVKAANRIQDSLGDRAHVNVTSYNRQVLITGEVPSAQDKQLVERIVGNVENVRNVVNELNIMGNSSLTQRSSDSLVTGRVKARLVDAQDLFANSFKVVTEHGTTYIMGRVTQREGTVAADVARGVGGVQKVVKLFDYISETELKQFQADPAPARVNNPVGQ